MSQTASNPARDPGGAFQGLLLVAGAACLVLLAMHFVRAVTGQEYLRHQKAYRERLADRTDRRAYPVRLRQVVLPGNSGIDRCVSCHVGLEDPAMADADQPLRTHPGSFLQDHDPATVGCSLCHDGDGRALDRMTAHGRAPGGRPVLPMPFMQANCVRCHLPDEIPDLAALRRGRDLFAEKQCLTCHELDGEGGRLAPDLTRIGDAHPAQKAPASVSAEAIEDFFGESLNTAYIFESIQHPQLQPGTSFMPDFGFEEDDLTALTVFLKSLSDRRAPEALQARRWRERSRDGK